MKNRILITLAACLLFSVIASASLIEHVSSNSISTVFDAGTGEMTVSDTTTLTVRYADSTVTQIADTQFSMIASLLSDNSAGGIAMGLFGDGSLNIADYNGVALLTGNISYIDLGEVGNNLGILSGYGEFNITGGSMMGDLPFLTGDLVQISFSITPRNISDFSQNFSGYSNVSLVPVPEPATIALLGLSSLALLKRRK